MHEITQKCEPASRPLKLPESASLPADARNYPKVRARQRIPEITRKCEPARARLVKRRKWEVQRANVTKHCVFNDFEGFPKGSSGHKVRIIKSRSIWICKLHGLREVRCSRRRKIRGTATKARPASQIWRSWTRPTRCCCRTTRLECAHFDREWVRFRAKMLVLRRENGYGGICRDNNNIYIYIYI